MGSSHLKLNISPDILNNSFNRNWKVSLQSLFLSNKLFNISGEKFNFQCEEKIKHDDYDKVKRFYNLKDGAAFPKWEKCSSAFKKKTSKRKPTLFLTCKKGAE